MIMLDSPEGYLYDKEAILQYMIQKKNEISRQMKVYEKEKRKEQVSTEIVFNLWLKSTATLLTYVTHFSGRIGRVSSS